MPAVPATGSTKIAQVDSSIIADLCVGKFFISASPSIYIGGGATSVLGANVQIKNPYGVIIKPYGANYEISPSLSGGMDAQIVFNIPTEASNYQYGKYTVDLQMFDESGSWVVSKSFSICEPDKNNKTKNYGSLSAKLTADCKAGKLYVLVDGVPTYKGKISESQVNDFTLLYPTVSELDPEEGSLTQFSTYLFEGVYKLTGEICASYNLGDNVFVNVKYKVKKEKKVSCLIDECCVYSKLAELHLKLKSDCTAEEIANTSNIAVDALRLLKTAKLAAECGEDPSDYISDLEALLGCKCTCNCLEGTPIIGTANPSSDIIVEGCNVSVEEIGLTTKYTIENYEYEVEVTPNGGALTASSATLAGCTKKQVLTFNVSVVYEQIKTLANANDSEAGFWASIINKSLVNLNPACLDITSEVWNAYSFAQKMAAVFTKICSCCGCGAVITFDEDNQFGSRVTINWNNNEEVFAVDAYLDGVFQGTVLAPGESFNFDNAANGVAHEWSLIAKCANGSYGNKLTGEFAYFGCPAIAPPNYISDQVTGTCPYDLTALVLTLPAGTTVEWHSSNNTLPASLVANPAAVLDGTYYAFSKDANGCLSQSAMALKVNCIAGESSCSAPQNLEVISFGGNSHLVRFDSAAYPPPGNSYTVKRKLASAPDVGGSYTTLGTPTYDLGMSKWIFNDTTASDNVDYTYLVQSNCGDSPQTTPNLKVDYVFLVCPTVSLTPSFSTGNALNYSFPPIGGDVNKYEVEIWDAGLTTLIEKDTHVPAFSNPVTGTFEYLAYSTLYNIRVIVYTPTMTKQCNFQSQMTGPSV